MSNYALLLINFLLVKGSEAGLPILQARKYDLHFPSVKGNFNSWGLREKESSTPPTFGADLVFLESQYSSFFLQPGQDHLHTPFPSLWTGDRPHQRFLQDNWYLQFIVCFQKPSKPHGSKIPPRGALERLRFRISNLEDIAYSSKKICLYFLTQLEASFHLALLGISS